MPVVSIVIHKQKKQYGNDTMKAKLLLFIILSLVLIGCHEPDYYDDNPEVVVNTVTLVDGSPSRYAKFIIEFENIGYGTAYDVRG